MIPIHKLLQRIRWDPRFAVGKFEIGYFDRHERRILVVPLESIEIPAGGSLAFEFNDDQGGRRRIPFHRVRRVWRDGRLIWERNPGTAGKTGGDLAGKK